MRQTRIPPAWYSYVRQYLHCLEQASRTNKEARDSDWLDSERGRCVATCLCAKGLPHAPIILVVVTPSRYIIYTVMELRLWPCCSLNSVIHHNGYQVS